MIGRVPVLACQAGRWPQGKQGVANGATGRQGARALSANAKQGADHEYIGLLRPQTVLTVN